MNLFFVGTFADTEYLTMLKPLLKGNTTSLSLDKVSTWAEVKHFCTKKQATTIISTSPSLLQKLTYSTKASIDNYAGSLFIRDGIEILFISPLKQLISVPYGQFLTKRYLSKILDKPFWGKQVATKFNYEVLTPANLPAIYESFKSALAIAVDIETLRHNLAIECIGYTAIFESDGQLETKSIVLHMDSLYALEWMRKFNQLPPAKIMQNGKYDCAYLARYNSPVHNYLWDTATMFHAWYAELPKDLASLGAFFVRDIFYWKDMADDEPDKYNAMDTWSTANIFINWILTAPDWAKQNYLMEFPLLFPCHLSEMTGIKRDQARLLKVRGEKELEIKTISASLDRLLGVTGFNVASPKQVKVLLEVLGCKDLPSTDEKSLSKAAYRHPLNNLILDKIVSIRKARKLVSTYLKVGEGAAELNGVVLYSLNPHGTDTGRQASKEHHFWCGLNVQNQPRGPDIKQTLMAYEGFLFGEVDLEQAESRDTAYISGDLRLIDAVENSPDFHSKNASLFFGIPFELIYDAATSTVLNKPLRTLAKPVNHGATYNMQANTLIGSMGLTMIYQAQSLLKLPKLWSPKQIAEYLLAAFHAAYPGIAGTYYPKVIEQVTTTNLLIGATGWTRYCFGNPLKNNQALNAYIAHNPQSLNAMVLNKAYLKVFNNIAMHPEHKDNFKLNAQIHDSILFQFREGHSYLCDMVKKEMEIPVTITSCTGVQYTFTVPAAIKAGKDGQGAKYWADTE